MAALPDSSPHAALLDALATGVLRLDDGLRVTYLNPSAEQILGIGYSRAVGARLTRLATLPAELHACLREALDHGQPCTDRQVSIEPHGQPALLVDCSVTPYGPVDGRRELVLELVSVDRPSRIARDEAMLAQQEHARSLMRGLAHEIKNPLGGLRGAAQLLERQLPDPELVEYTSIIIREADRLQGLIDRMLGPANRPASARVNVHEVLEHVRKMSGAGAAPGVALRFDYDPTIPEFLSDRDRLVQVFLNIAVNALEAVGDGGTVLFRTRVASNVTIGATRHPLVAMVSVRDDGPGVPPELIGRIFYPMVTGTDHGTGLGLSIAQSTINQLGGLIECESRPGDTVFTVLIPLEPA